MSKLKLVAAPTFKAKVGIPLAGGVPVEVEMTFKHRTKTGLDEFMASRAATPEPEFMMAMVEGWDLEDPFNKENVELLLQNFIGSYNATFLVYVEQLIGSRIKN